MAMNSEQFEREREKSTKKENRGKEERKKKKKIDDLTYDRWDPLHHLGQNR